MLKLEELLVYQVAMQIGDIVYLLVTKWPTMDRETLGKQVIRSADSIALNIAEGYGRFFYKENKQFCYYSRGSSFETITALQKAKMRNLITENDFAGLKEKMEYFHRLLNGYIKSIGEQNQ